MELKFILKWAILNTFTVQIMQDAFRIFETQFQEKTYFTRWRFFMNLYDVIRMKGKLSWGITDHPKIHK